MQEAEPSWFGSDLLPKSGPPYLIPMTGQEAFSRLWNGFMTARVMVALVLLLLQAFAYWFGRSEPVWLLGLCVVYLGAAIAVRLLAHPTAPGHSFDPQWMATIAVDVCAFSVLHTMQGGAISYTPLFAMPVLLSAVLGSLPLAMGTTAAVTLLLLADAWWGSLSQPAETTARFLQAGLTGSGLFIVAFLTHQLALRLAREEAIAQRSERQARLQTLVSELVIENLTDGVLVIDASSVVRAANPAARRLIGGEEPANYAPLLLDSESGWHPLGQLTRLTFAQGNIPSTDLDLHHPGLPPSRLQVRTQLATALTDNSESLCVMFLQDRRELEARVRTEKLAAMGRMSAAVAHEIRNPLATIAQANALLDEELTDPAQKRLTLMVRQNTQRLARIVDDILDLARVEHRHTDPHGTRVALDEAVQHMCADWLRQASLPPAALVLALNTGDATARFEPDHLRRVLVNLLDNARRYARHAAPVHVSTEARSANRLLLRVWSDGPPLEATVQRHLFEPFFSSESRSSGLGLYICRELCQRHGASISHERSERPHDGHRLGGNEFIVVLQAATLAAPHSN
jgi:two-component system sensor histidine kinase PilS (NtrC family)